MEKSNIERFAGLQTVNLTYVTAHLFLCMDTKLEDTKGVIRKPKSKKYGQYNGPVCCCHNPVLRHSFMNCHRIFNKSNSATCLAFLEHLSSPKVFFVEFVLLNLQFVRKDMDVSEVFCGENKVSMATVKLS
jgi:hypothetical protein